MKDLLNLSLEEITEIRNEALVASSRFFTTAGFSAWYERVHGNPLPVYQKEEWIDAIFEAKKKDLGALLFAFRGSWKTTTVSMTFTPFFIGHHPTLANLVIGASGSSANQITEAVKNIIEFTDAWKECFPHIVPDYKRGWGEEGYEVMDTSVGSYEDWRALNTTRKDPTLMGLGVGSKTLIGKHPEGLLIMDDILDEDNTVSVKQMNSVATKVTGTILPFIVEDDSRPVGDQVLTWPIVIGTPWTDDDVYQDIRNTGEFVFSKIPIMRPCGEEDPGAIRFDHEKLIGWFKLTDPKKHGKSSIIRLYNRAQHKEFMRMYMLDLSVKMEGEGLTYHQYPHEKIDWTATMVAGVDYMSMIKDKNVDLKNRAYYAQAYLFKLSDGRGVIGDGWYGRPTQAEAETRMEQAEVFAGHRSTVFESDGKGEEALQVFLRNPNLTIIPMQTHGQGKEERLEKQLGPWMERGTILISDGDTPFLNFLRKCLSKYPKWYLDPIDAVYWAMRGMPEILKYIDKNEVPATPEQKKKKKKRYESPYDSLGSH